MSKRNLPGIPMAARASIPHVNSYIDKEVLARWNPQVKDNSADENTIGILDPIGYDPWTGEGVTAKRIAGALRNIGPKNDVTVSINSPGGDMFEGLAIYNMLREHEGHVTVKVLGLAASAASIIAMAGDTVKVARAGFLMIHNAWVIAVGNRNDLRDYADRLEPMDRAMADVYAARTGMSARKISTMMDSESWIGGSDAVDQGFADDLLSSDSVGSKGGTKNDARLAANRLDAALAQAGMSRTERRDVLRKYADGMRDAADRDDDAGMPGATSDDMRGAVDSLLSIQMQSLNLTLETDHA